MFLGHGGPQVGEVTRLGGVTHLYMNSNGKFDVSLDGTFLSHTTNLNAFVLTPAVRICGVRAPRERKYQLPVATFDVRGVNVLVAKVR